MDDFKLGEFIVRVQVRRDNPAFPCYVIYKGGAFVGKSFSRPSVDDARWLLRNAEGGTLYASVSTRVKPKLRGAALTRGTRR